MLTLLIVISLTLHVVTFLIIRSQAEKMSSVKEKEIMLNNQKNEMEELLSTYLFEMKEENNRFLSDFTKKEVTREPADITGEHNPDLNNPIISEQENNFEISKKPSGETYEKKSQYVPPLTLTGEDSVETSKSSQALSLYNNGESIDAIAKKLNCGKTEVELMLKFYKK